MKKLNLQETEKLLGRYRIPFLRQYLARDLVEASRHAGRIGYPVVLKVASEQISHKTEVDGVKLNIRNEPELKRSYTEMMNSISRKRVKAKIDGVLVQKMLTGRNVREVIIGSKQDEQFGPVIMFGLGGIFVEVLKDVSFRLVPIVGKDARDMISEIKGRRVLEAFRGREPINFKELEDCLLKVSKMVDKNRIRELDINPLLVDDKNVYAADVRIFVE
jgi:acetyltransferase